MLCVCLSLCVVCLFVPVCCVSVCAHVLCLFKPVCCVSGCACVLCVWLCLCVVCLVVPVCCVSVCACVLCVCMSNVHAGTTPQNILLGDLSSIRRVKAAAGPHTLTQPGISSTSDKDRRGSRRAAAHTASPPGEVPSPHCPSSADGHTHTKTGWLRRQLRQNITKGTEGQSHTYSSSSL